MLVIKRDKHSQKFNLDKVKSSIRRVFKVCDQELSENSLESIVAELKVVDGMRTEELQRQVEDSLMKRGYYNAARFYIIYRHIHYHDKNIANKAKFLREYLGASNAATGSKFDANANVTEKNLVTAQGELYKGDIISLNRYRLCNKIKELFGEDLAKDYVKLLESHIMYKHDESSLLPYCVAISIYPFLTGGFAKLGGISQPPHNLDSFCGSFPNLCFAIAAQFAGALATPEFLAYFDYFARKDLGKDYMTSLNDFHTVGPGLKKLMSKTGKYFTSLTQLKNYKFESEEDNLLRDSLLVADKPGRLSDGSRTIGGHLDQKFQQIVYTINQPASARLYQSIFWNIGYFDEGYFEGIFGDFKFPDGTPMVWSSIEKLQKYFMNWFNNERTKAVLTFPVESFSVLTNKDHTFRDPDAADFIAEMYSKGHSFFTYMSDNPDALSSCCRLRNEMKENSFSFSLGMSGVMTGSKSVMTININRAVQYAVNNKLNYVDYIRDLVHKIHKFQIAFNELLYEFKDQGALPVYDAGFITLEKQFLTIGVNGVVEAAEFLGMKASPNEEYQEFCASILGMISEENMKAKQESIERWKSGDHNYHKVQFNTEFVPAENLGVKFYKWDKRDGYKVPSTRNCYNSYFYASEDDSLTIIDKFKLHGNGFVSKLDGGSAIHCNMDQHLSKEQYKQVLKIAAMYGTNYFTFNIPNTLCNDCGHIDKRYLKACPKCGSSNVDYLTRIIGYLKRISNFSEARQLEAHRRYYLNAKHDINPDESK